MTMCVNIGHGNQKVIRAIQEQVAQLPYAAPGMATKIRALASKAVAEVTPGGKLSKILFTLGGADANENAIKLARGYTGRFKILTRYRSYHGATAGALALTGDPRRTAWEPGVMPGVVHFSIHIAIAPPSIALTPIFPKKTFARTISITSKKSSSTKVQRRLPPSCSKRLRAQTASSSHRMDICRACVPCAINTGL